MLIMTTTVVNACTFAIGVKGWLPSRGINSHSATYLDCCLVCVLVGPPAGHRTRHNDVKDVCACIDAIKTVIQAAASPKLAAAAVL